MSGQVLQLAKGISFGIGSSSPVITDQRLQFEIGRAEVSNVFYDYTNNKVIFKAIVPTGASGVVTELGLWSDISNSMAGTGTDRILASFEDEENWSNTPTWSAVSTITRLGTQSLRQAPTGGATVSNELFDASMDLSFYSSADKFVFAWYNANTNPASVVFRFKTDSTNYFSTTFTNPIAGYHFDEVTKGSLAVAGVPNWSNIQTIEVLTTSKAAVVSTVDFDGITIADVDTVNPNYILIARQLETAFTLVPGVLSEIEYPLGVTV